MDRPYGSEVEYSFQQRLHNINGLRGLGFDPTRQHRCLQHHCLSVGPRPDVNIHDLDRMCLLAPYNGSGFTTRKMELGTIRRLDQRLCAILLVLLADHVLLSVLPPGHGEHGKLGASSLVCSHTYRGCCIPGLGQQALHSTSRVRGGQESGRGGLAIEYLT
jgi:hypothetical protein